MSLGKGPVPRPQSGRWSSVMGKLQGLCCVCARIRYVVCMGQAGGSRVTHRFFRSRTSRQVHVQVVVASKWCLRVGRVRFGSVGIAHHWFPVRVCLVEISDLTDKS